ncbi:hypothetical protein BH10BAC4_BH10BAC4_10300 [soil metagenome]
MKTLIVVTLLFSSIAIHSQNIIEWNENYRLQLTDFQSPQTEIGNVDIISLYNSASIDFSFQMTNGEFIFTKNFNSKVDCSFRRSAAFILAPDSSSANDLLEFARYEFDLTELYARKFRKQLFEKKGAFSNLSFFQPLYDDNQREYADRHAKASKETELGKNKATMQQLDGAVRKEIEELQDFCKTCKPVKKKK